jgi:hypothetical protein
MTTDKFNKKRPAQMPSAPVFFCIGLDFSGWRREA